jgi:elongation factor P
MGSMNDITRGSTIDLNQQLWEVIEHLHARTGQRKPTVWTKLRNLRTGKVTEHQFKPSDKVHFVRIETTPMEYLYRDGQSYVFMNQETYEQPSLPKELIEHMLDFLIEGTVCSFRFNESDIVGTSLPDIMEFEVIDAPPHVRGDTATNDYRAVTISSGTQVKVPPFIKQGEIIKIDTRTKEYSGRAKT